MVGEEKKTPQEMFREGLEDLSITIAALAPYCQNLDDIYSMIRLAMDNDGQLNLLMALVKNTRAKK